MSSVLFLAHRSRAHVLTRVLTCEGRTRERERGKDTWREKEPRESEGRNGGKRREKERGEQIVETFRAQKSTCSMGETGGRVENGIYIYMVYAAVHRREAGIGEDRTRWATRERGIGWMEEGRVKRREGKRDGWTRGKRAHEFVCPFFGGEAADSAYRFGAPRRHSYINARTA